MHVWLYVWVCGCMWLRACERCMCDYVIVWLCDSVYFDMRVAVCCCTIVAVWLCV